MNGPPTDTLSYILTLPRISIKRVVQEWNVFFDIQQTVQYEIYNEEGVQIGMMLERKTGKLGAISRQLDGTDRPFCIDLIDMQGNILLSVTRPFKVIRSHCKISIPYNGMGNGMYSFTDNRWKKNDRKYESIEIGECNEKWTFFKKKYELVENGRLFGKIKSEYLSWEFPIFDVNDGSKCAQVTRKMSNWQIEMFSDGGIYSLEFNPNGSHSLDLNKRCVVLSTVVAIDFDQFSLHSKDESGFDNSYY
ncbi:hypothetical protein DAPK24_027950 [Pichia kluyveri]|uniref:Phospholipid scramblase n=1 Tax=Pichia kluyveri TaxID=36015 RepID=A0AAV5R4L3_PICKL|nr:hypothetical protein DAPK24_027950 [Pichia kluyveri]